MSADINDNHHVARYCKSRDVENELPNISAFLLRSNDKCCLSVNWLEYFETSDQKTAIDKIREVVGKKLRLDSEGIFIVLDVGGTKNTIYAIHTHMLQIKRDPKSKDRSHSCIILPESNQYLISKALADNARNIVQGVYPAVQ